MPQKSSVLPVLLASLLMKKSHSSDLSDTLSSPMRAGPHTCPTTFRRSSSHFRRSTFANCSSSLACSWSHLVARFPSAPCHVHRAAESAETSPSLRSHAHLGSSASSRAVWIGSHRSRLDTLFRGHSHREHSTPWARTVDCYSAPCGKSCEASETYPFLVLCHFR